MWELPLGSGHHWETSQTKWAKLLRRCGFFWVLNSLGLSTHKKRPFLLRRLCGSCSLPVRLGGVPGRGLEWFCMLSFCQVFDAVLYFGVVDF